MEATDYKSPISIGIPITLTSNSADMEEAKTAHCLNANDSCKAFGINQTHNAVCIPVITPERAAKRQNGRRFKEDGEESFTLTAQDRHGVAIGVSESKNLATKSDSVVALGVDIKAISSKTRGNGMREGYSPTLDHNCYVGVGTKVDGYNTETDGTSRTIKAQYKQVSRANLERSDGLGATGAIIQIADENDDSEHPDIYVKLSGGLNVYAVWHEKYQCYITIRKLTPKECYRLQGWTDDCFKKAQFVLSDSQLYKTAGNGVTVNVVYEIAKALAIAKTERKDENDS